MLDEVKYSNHGFGFGSQGYAREKVYYVSEDHGGYSSTMPYMGPSHHSSHSSHMMQYGRPPHHGAHHGSAGWHPGHQSGYHSSGSGHYGHGHGHSHGHGHDSGGKFMNHYESESSYHKSASHAAPPSVGQALKYKVGSMLLGGSKPGYNNGRGGYQKSSWTQKAL